MVEGSNTESSTVPSHQPRKFLIGGSGWLRRTTAATIGSKAYVPKGGHIVDFSSREPPSLKQLNLLHKSRREGKERVAGQGIQTSNTLPQMADIETKQRINAPKCAAISFKPSVQDMIDTIVAKAGDEDLSGGHKLKTRTVEWVEVPMMAKLMEESSYTPKAWPQPSTISTSSQAEKGKEINTPARQQWRPPGPCTPPRSGVHRGVGAHRRGITAFGTNKKANNKVATPPHDCSTCKCCLEVREKLQSAEAAARQDRAVAGQLRRRLETELARAAKEQRDFEAFKEAELARVQAEAAAAAHRQYRDRLAEGSRQRAAAKESTQKEKLEVETLRAQLEAERRDAGRNEGRHRLEVERLRRQISRLERENAELTAGLQEAESDRLQAWDEAQRLREEAQQAQQAALLGSSTSASSLGTSEFPAIVSLDATPHHATTSRSYSSPESPENLLAGNLSPSSISTSSAVTEQDTHSTPNTYPTDSSTKTLTSPNSRLPTETEYSPATSPTPQTGPSRQPQPLTTASSKPQATAHKKKSLSTVEVVQYPNGTVRHQWLDGHAVTSFPNGDIKQEFPSGIVEYFYEAVGVWQRTHASGIETFYFPNGKIESHMPDGGKEALMPEGSGAVRALQEGGVEVPVPVSTLHKETLLPKPMQLILDK